MTQTLDEALELFVRRLSSRSMLSEDERAALRGLRGPIVRIPAHVDIVRLDVEVDHACLIVDGLVGRFGQTGAGDRQITCLYIPGDIADLASVMTPKSGWALGALANTTIMRIAHVALRRLAAQHPGIAEAFWRDCVADGSIFSEWVVNVGRRDALSRLAHLFCEMAIRSEKAGHGNRTSFPLPITQVALGEATGLSGVHVNRTLRELRVQSIVELRGGIVTVHDWPHLLTIGDFDPAFLLFDGPLSRVS